MRRNPKTPVPIRVTRSVIPSLFTSMNLFCGFFAIVKATHEEYMAAAWLIVMAAIFDALDGAMARLTNSSSEFGVELDSLADVVSFGTAPAFILYMAFFHQWETVGVIIASAPAIAGALRLARFNVQLVGFDKDYFRGLPIPAAALALISYLVYYHLPEQSPVPVAWRPWAIAAITLGVSLLMVSSIRYDTLPRPSRRSIRRNPIKFVGLLAAVVLAVATRGSAIFPLMSLYLLFGIGRQILGRMRTGEDDRTMEEPETTPFDV